MVNNSLLAEVPHDEAKCRRERPLLAGKMTN